MSQTFTKNLWGVLSRPNHDYFHGHRMPTLKAKAGLRVQIAAKIQS